MCRCTSKTLLLFLSLIFWAAAACLFAISICVFTTYKQFSDFLESHYVLVPASVLMAVGLIFFFAGCVGCCTMCKDNRCLLASFAAFLFVLIGLLIAASVCVFVYKSEIDDVIRNQTKNVMNEYNSTASMQNQVDYLQGRLHCCGVENYEDWKFTPWGHDHPDHVPTSCCMTPHDNCTASFEHPDQLFDTGCYKKLHELFVKNLIYIAGAAIGFSILLTLGFVATCVLICQRRTAQDGTPYFSLSTQQ